MAKLSRMNKVLICVFSIYWFIIFPIIWFVIRPASIVHHLGQALLFALFLLIVYLMLHGIVVCVFKKIQMESSGIPQSARCGGASANPNWTVAEEHLLGKGPYLPETTVVSEKEKEAKESLCVQQPKVRRPRPMSSFRNPYEGTATSRLLRSMQANPKYERNITTKFIAEEQQHTNHVMAKRKEAKDCCKDKSEKYVASIKLFYDGNKKFQFDA